MTTKLAEQKLELNSALLKVIEKDDAIERLSEQLQIKSWIFDYVLFFPTVPP
jgi:hypothetical protein